jgi:hypothetical protein
VCFDLIVTQIFRFCSDFQFVRKNCEKRVFFFFRHVCPSVWNNSAPTGRILVKFNILVFF